MPSHTDISSAAIIGDKNCIYCGASLHGVSSMANCPSCGRLAGYSLLGDHLRDAESTWTRRMMVGILSVIGAYGVVLAWNGAAIAAIVDPNAKFVETNFLKLFLALAGWLTYLVGVVLLVQRETSGSLLSRRRGVAQSLLCSTILFIIFGLVPKRYFWDFAQTNGLIVKVAVSSLMFIISQSVLWIILRRIIDRTPRREVSNLLTLAFWISLPLNLVLSEASYTLLGQWKNHEQAVFIGTIGLHALGILKSVLAILLLILTRKGIRRTVGYWDN